jgi:hypothetical protein
MCVVVEQLNGPLSSLLLSKSLLVCPTPKHRSKVSLISHVLRCHYVWVGQEFEDFLSLRENVFLIQYRGVVLLFTC